jgi:hypothetical protein
MGVIVCDFRTNGEHAHHHFRAPCPGESKPTQSRPIWSREHISVRSKRKKRLSKYQTEQKTICLVPNEADLGMEKVE